MQHGRGDADAVYGAAAAAAVMAERREVGHRLNRLGVVVTEATPELFASHVADAYLSLKAAGRL
jgi:hypothetical protein